MCALLSATELICGKHTDRQTKNGRNLTAQQRSHQVTSRQTKTLTEWVLCVGGWVRMQLLLFLLQHVDSNVEQQQKNNNIDYCIKTRRGMKTERMPCAAMRYISPLSRRREWLHHHHLTLHGAQQQPNDAAGLLLLLLLMAQCNVWNCKWGCKWLPTNAINRERNNAIDPMSDEFIS